MFIKLDYQFFQTVDLSTSLNLEVLRPLLLNEDFMKRISDTLPPIAEANKSNNLAEQFTSTVQSPQFQQALNSFSSALQSGQLGPLIQQFGLPEDCVVAANTGSKFLLNFQQSLFLILFKF